jgi:hypothetical protein
MRPFVSGITSALLSPYMPEGAGAAGSPFILLGHYICCACNGVGASNSPRLLTMPNLADKVVEVSHGFGVVGLVRKVVPQIRG